MSKKILVGLSGGVDSAVSAYLLREAGYDVACGFMINYLDEEHPESCPTRPDLEEARRVAEYLGLPFYTFDYREEYEKRIVEYIYREYELGRTPNPDVFCNNLVKFDLFLEEALSLGYDGIATGHYARTGYFDKRESGNFIFNTCGTRSSNSDSPRYFIGNIPDSGENIKSIVGYVDFLCKGIDPTKDQSYFLSRLSSFQLSKALFPIGHLPKSEVREIAKEAGLPNALRKDSQGLCFIGKVSMKEFLERRIPKKPGNIVNTDGKVIGQHEGAFSYTIGQRKGIGVGGGPALFVVAKDIKNNTVTVGNEQELSLYSSSCILEDWIGQFPEEGKIYGAKIRYRQEDQECEWRKINEAGKIEILFKNPQRAVTSGQICVVYDGERVVGSGVIT